MYFPDKTVIKDRREMLRVKAKSLAEEARIIRREESRIRGDLYNELRWHRIKTVRYEARATFLAYGLIRGRPLDRIEKAHSERTEDLWKKVRGMIERYGPTSPADRAQLLENCKTNNVTTSTAL